MTVLLTHTHNRLLHKKKPEQAEESNLHKPKEKHEGESVENSQTSAITKEAKEKSRVSYVLLQTVPVILKNRSKKIVVNALLDDGSTDVYQQ